MLIEIRANGTAIISGYVNATEKKSNPVITPHGKVVEEIEPGALYNSTILILNSFVYTFIFVSYCFCFILLYLQRRLE